MQDPDGIAGGELRALFACRKNPGVNAAKSIVAPFGGRKPGFSFGAAEPSNETVAG